MDNHIIVIIIIIVLRFVVLSIILPTRFLCNFYIVLCVIFAILPAFTCICTMQAVVLLSVWSLVWVVSYVGSCCSISKETKLTNCVESDRSYRKTENKL